MTKTTTITVRLDPQVKKDAQALLKELGLTTTQAVSLFFKSIIFSKGLPFVVEMPNEQTIQAIEDGLNNRNLKTFENAEAAIDILINRPGPDRSTPPNQKDPRQSGTEDLFL